MNWLIILRCERDKYVLAKTLYCEYSKREAIKKFRQDNGLVGKHLGNRLYVERTGAVV